MDFDPGAGVVNLTSAGGRDAFVQKLDAAGNLVWVKRMGGLSDDIGLSISADTSGNVYTLGRFEGTVDFNPGPATNNLISNGIWDIFIQKLDSSGSFVWVKQIGGYASDEPHGLTTDAAGNVYTTGCFDGTVDFDPGAGSYNLSSGGASDIFIQKLNTNGNLVWAVKMGSGSSDKGYAIATDGNNNVYTTGFFAGTVDFDPGTDTSDLTSVNSIMDVFVQKLSPCYLPPQPEPIQGDTTVCAGTLNSYSVVYDPSAIYYVWSLPPGWSGISVTDTIHATASSAGGTIMVTAHNICGASIVQTFTVSVTNIPPVPGFISGDTAICPGSTQNYSVLNDSTATLYTWTLPGGWSGSSVTHTISATADTSGGILSVSAGNACGNSMPQMIIVNVHPLPSVTASASDTNLCAGEPTTLTGSGAFTYVWTGGVADGSPFSPPATATYTVTGTDTNLCSGAATITIVVHPLPNVNFAFSGDDTVCINYGALTLSGGSPSGGVYAGPGVSGGFFDPGAAGVGTHILSYAYSDANGCSGSDQTGIVVLGCMATDTVHEDPFLLVYPNPFADFIRVVGLNNRQEVRLFNNLGQSVGTWSMDATGGILLTRELVPGIYILHVRDGSDNSIRKLVKY